MTTPILFKSPFHAGRVPDILKNIVFPLILFFAAYAQAFPAEQTENPDYADGKNWVIRQDEAGGANGAGGADRLFDVFYIYPTLVSDREKALMDWSDRKTAEKTIGFVRAQTGIFGKDARIFAPYVRQLEYKRCMDGIGGGEWEQTLMRQGIEDTAAAFRYYMKHCNKGRPYILFGHSQGAMDLYCLLKSEKEISGEKGFAAAYLIGLPRVDAARFQNDFKGRSIKPAGKADDTAVVIVWNTQNGDAEKSMFTGKGTLCINPLNWRTDASPAPASLNLEAVFYDYRNGKCKRGKNFCGAVVDLSKGALLVDLPSMSEYDAEGFMGKGIFHGNDIWFFAGNIRENAVLRVKSLLKRNSASASPAAPAEGTPGGGHG